MNDTWYQLIVGTLDLFAWSGELIGEENLPQHGPAVFIANHAESIGPIAACCSIPLRLYPWIIADMVDRDLAPAYLQWDFVERNFSMKPPISLWISKLLSRVTVPLLRSIGCIPVYKGDYEHTIESLQQSMKVLLQGKFLLVFPEDNSLPMDPATKMQPFQRTFVRLGEMYYEETGQRLEFYPVTIHTSGYVEVGKAVAHDPLNSVGLERHRLKDLMENTIKAMYLQLEGGKDYLGKLIPQHK